MTNGTVQVELRVTNRELTDDLRNTSSSAYLQFVKNFTEKVEGRGTLPGVTMCLVVHPNAFHGCRKRRGSPCMIFSRMYLGGPQGGPGGRGREWDPNIAPGDLFSSR